MPEAHIKVWLAWFSTAKEISHRIYSMLHPVRSASVNTVTAIPAGVSRFPAEAPS
jgi:hypothetical protein